MGFLGDVGGFFSGGGAIGSAISAMTGQDAGSMWGDAITGGALSNAKSVAETNEKQMQLANQQMAFQERMSNSAYQRAVEDMRKAGLNPALAYQNGGASQPSGAMAQLTAPRKGDVGAGLLNTAKSIATGIPEIKTQQTQATLNQANATSAEANAQKLTANAQESIQYKQLIQQQTEKAKHDTKTAKLNSQQTEMETALKKLQFPAASTVAPLQPYMDRAGQASGIVSTAKKWYQDWMKSRQSNTDAEDKKWNDESSRRYFNQNGGIDGR